MRKCPYCAEDIQDAAIKCRFCGERLDGPSHSSPGPEENPTAASTAAAEPQPELSSTATMAIMIISGIAMVVFLCWMTLDLDLSPSASSARTLVEAAIQERAQNVAVLTDFRVSFGARRQVPSGTVYQLEYQAALKALSDCCLKLEHGIPQVHVPTAVSPRDGRNLKAGETMEFHGTLLYHKAGKNWVVSR